MVGTSEVSEASYLFKFEYAIWSGALSKPAGVCRFGASEVPSISSENFAPYLPFLAKLSSWIFGFILYDAARQASQNWRELAVLVHLGPSKLKFLTAQLVASLKGFNHSHYGANLKMEIDHETQIYFIGTNALGIGLCFNSKNWEAVVLSSCRFQSLHRSSRPKVPFWRIL